MPQSGSIPKQEFHVSDAYEYKRRTPTQWIISHLLRYKRLLLIFFATPILSNILSAALPLIMGAAFNEVLHAQANQSRLLQLTLFGLGIAILQFATNLISNVSNAYLGQRLDYDVRDELFLNLLGKSQTFHNRQRVGDIMARMSHDVAQLRPMVVFGIHSVFTSLLQLVIPIVVIAIYKPPLLLAPILFTAGFLITLRLYITKIFPIAGQFQASYGKLNAGLAEAIRNIELVKTTAQETFERKAFQANAAHVHQLFLARGRAEAYYLPPLVLTASLVFGFLHGWYLISIGQFAIGDLVAYLGLMLMLLQPTTVSIFSFAAIYSGIAGAERILALINEEAQLDENDQGHRAIVRGEIIFKNVSFAYNGQLVLKNISFKVQPGQTIALVGQAGAGKSTLTRLVNRIYDVNEGCILVDGVDVREWNLNALRGQIATIAQDSFLFSRSVAENIAFGTGQQSDTQAIEQAAREAQAHEFVSQFLMGYDTLIGERGVMLSGGQQQRVAIARALLTNPRVLIMDDSTSAVDSATEDKIQNAIQRLQKGRTTFLITHRLSQIIQANHILLLKQGELTDQGSHEELLQRSEEYRRIFTPYEISYQSSQIATV